MKQVDIKDLSVDDLTEKLQEQKDSEFLETYNRLKDAGLIN